MTKKLLKRVSREMLAPSSRKSTPIFKIKKKPRGKPFEVGNRYGFATRFRKGEVANPEGRPSLKKMNAACRDRLAQIVPRDELVAAGLPISLFGKSYAELNAWVLAQEGMRGNVAALDSLADRAEGRPGVASPDDGETSPLRLLILSMNERSDEIGPAEGMERKRLTEGGEDDGPEQEAAVG
ncbi:MAG: hypothetical protein WA581_13720 [Candidatus Acidiferrales bacterium]